MKTTSKYTKTEKILMITSLVFLIPAFIIALISENENIGWISLVIAIISASEFIFIIAYRDYIDGESKIEDDTSTVYHSTAAVAITKIFSIIAACFILVGVAFLYAVLYEFLNSLLPALRSILLPISLIIIAFIAFVLINKMIVQSIYKTPKK